MTATTIIIGAAPRVNATVLNAATASRRDAERRERDIADNFYPTPPEATRLATFESGVKS